MNEKNQKVRNALISAGIKFYSERTFDNGDWRVIVKYGKYIKLYRDGVNVLEGISATGCFSYTDGYYVYIVNGFYHIIREGEDLLKDVDATDCWVNTDGSWGYEDEEGEYEMAKDERINPMKTELTMQEIADLAGCDVNNLKIKK